MWDFTGSSNNDILLHHVNDIPSLGRQHQLPHEIISLILQHCQDDQPFLYECAIVSKRCHDDIIPLLWKAPHFRNGNITAQFLACLSAMTPSPLASVGLHIRELCLFSHHWTDRHLLNLLPAIPLLDRLTLQGDTAISEASFQHVPRHCRHLRLLHLSIARLTQVTFSALGQHCTKLQDLEWSPSTSQSIQWLAALQPCPLARLRLVLIPSPMDTASMTMLQTSFGGLTCLEISHSGPAVLTPLLLGNRHWPRLTTLALTPCTGIDDPTWLHFIQYHDRLQHVELADDSEVTDASLDAMAAGLPALTLLTLTRNKCITTNGLRQFVRQCQHLRRITVLRCERLVTDEFPESQVRSRLMVVLDRNAIERIKQVSVE